MELMLQSSVVFLSLQIKVKGKKAIRKKNLRYFRGGGPSSPVALTPF